MRVLMKNEELVRNREISIDFYGFLPFAVSIFLQYNLLFIEN